MKRLLAIIAYSVFVTALLLFVGYRDKEKTPPVLKTDYSGFWKTEQAEKAPTSRLVGKDTGVTFKDKSMATGVDAAPKIAAA